MMSKFWRQLDQFLIVHSCSDYTAAFTLISLEMCVRAVLAVQSKKAESGDRDRGWATLLPGFERLSLDSVYLCPKEQIILEIEITMSSFRIERLINPLLRIGTSSGEHNIAWTCRALVIRLSANVRFSLVRGRLCGADFASARLLRSSIA